MFALANGHIGLRGNLDEGEPHGLPGTYLNGFYEARPLPYAEAGYGYPEAGQTVVNVTNGKIIRLLVDDEPFDVRFGELRSHERVLDFRAGVLRRRVEWLSPAGRQVRVSSVRLVSFVQRAVAAVLYEVEPLDSAGPARACSQSSWPTSRCRPRRTIRAPRASCGVAAALRAVLRPRRQGRARALDQAERAADGRRHGSRRRGPARHRDDAAESGEDLGRVTITADVEPGQRLRVVKFLAYGWSSQRSTAALRDQVAAALAEARHTGWDGLLADQRAYLDDFWERADVELDGDAELQQAVRFALFHTLQAGARGERRAIAAKGLTGPGYDGHAFWDTETLRPAGPDLHRPARRPRRAALAPRDARPGARAGQAARARRARPFPGGRSTGRSARATGRREPPPSTSTPTSPTPSAATRPRPTTQAFEREAGLELLVETARLWRSLGHHDADGRFRIDGVTGPDEYSAIADNNVYTNLMAQRNLRAGRRRRRAPPRPRRRARRRPRRRRPPGATPPQAMLIPYDEALGVHPQAEGFTEHQPWDFARTAPEQYPLLLHFPYFDLYRKQVVKQADLVLALHLRGDAFSAEEKARNFAYYEALTVRDSSLSACTQAVDRGRGRPPRAGLRLLRRGRPDRPRRPRAQHPRRPAHRLAGRRLDRRRRRLRRHARPRRRAQLRAAAAASD